MNLLLVGLNHRTATVQVRERVAFRTDDVPAALRRLSELPAVREAMILSTCNRVEVVSHVEDLEQGKGSLESFLMEAGRIAPDELQRKLYYHEEERAVRHLFRVASSLDSMILGEPQILGQVKSFYSLAVQAQTVGATLNGLLQAAFRTAKRVRRETSIGEYAVSVSSAAVELARKIIGDLKNTSVLIVGAGKMGENAVRHLLSAGARKVRVTNRSAERAGRLADSFQGEAVPFGDLTQWMARSDIVITSTGSPEILVDPALTRTVIMLRKNVPIVFIDISVPRNVDPAVNQIENVFCYDIDDLGAVVEANAQERRHEATLAERIVEQEVASFCEGLRSRDINPVVVQLNQKIEAICRTELERYLNKAGPRDEKEQQELESMVSRIAGKIAHPLITQLRNARRDPLHQEAYLDTIKRIFKI